MQISKAILCVSACAITALAIVEAGRMNDPAQAGTALIGQGGVIAITSSVGKGPDAEPYETLYVIDNRSEMLFVYGMDGGATPRLVLRGGASLPALFRAARGG
jgi:hypothetical protein